MPNRVACRSSAGVRPSHLSEGVDMERNSTTSTNFTTSPAFAAARANAASSKQQFSEVFKKENAVTRRVLAALPEGQSEFRPHPSSKTAREVA